MAPVERVVRFPSEESLGPLFVREWGAPDLTDLSWEEAQFRDGWRPLGPASGAVAVPAGQELALLSGDALLPDLSPKDLQCLITFGLSDSELAPAARCTALRQLTIGGNSLTAAGLAQLAGLGSLERLGIWGSPLTGGALAHLSRLRSLRWLLLGDAQFPGRDLAYLSELDSLQTLSLPFSHVDATGLAALAHLPLKDLRLERCLRINDAALAQLREVTSLVQLEIHETSVTDAGIAHLAGLTNLEVLWLGPWVTDLSLEVVAGLPRLRHLDLCARGITDSGIAHLTSLSNLQTLYLNYCALTDAGVDHLTRMRGLRELSLKHTRISATGLSRLREALPECTI
ncbi:MAG: hypothetical protein HY013_03535 [Candidatus Solibacter usitatus]|nr:hypothetical protein [Candidatus Solibacter usitatus]